MTLTSWSVKNNVSNLSLTISDSLYNDLQDAIARSQFQLVYQPKVCVKTHHTTGAEVLLRWHHPLKGLVPADQWVPLAESHNLMRPLTLWIVGNVIATLKAAGTQAIPLAINVPPDILNSAFALHVARALKAAGVPPHLLEIEITETSPVKDMASLVNGVCALKSEGLKIYLDDLGTGYSTMRYLVDLPVHGAKMDKSFIHQAQASGAACLILKTLMQLAREIGLTVVCEGIETHEQLALVKKFGTHIVQGYLISRPLNAEGFSQWLAKPPFPTPL